MGNETSSALLGEALPADALFAGPPPDVDEALLYTEPETFVYRVGARASAQGHTAASWGLEAPLLTASLRVTALGSLVCLALWRKAAAPSPPPPSTAQQRYPVTLLPLASGHALVALCRIPLSGPAQQPLAHFLEPVLDSSRYFVLRCVPPPGPRAAGADAVLLGFGFRHREAAFQLKACIADHVRSFERQAAGAAAAAAAAAAAEAAAATAAAATAAAAAAAAAGQQGGGEEEGADDFGGFACAPPPPPQPKASLAARSIPLLRPPPPPPSAAALSPPPPPLAPAGSSSP